MRLFIALAVLLVAAHLCHVGILWEGDTLPLATAQQMLRGKVLYRDIWFDKPPLVPAFYLLWGARAGWPLRLAGALYGLLACWIAFAFARDLWGRREGLWAAGLLGFFLIFDFPATVIPVASDLLMLAPHLAAVWLAFRRRPFWAGSMAAVACWISPKGLFVLAACMLWTGLRDRGSVSVMRNPFVSRAKNVLLTEPRSRALGIALIAAGFAAASGVAVAALAGMGALGSYWNEVWRWGRLYAGSPFVEAPLQNGVVRTLNWLGFHAALIVAVLWRSALGLRTAPRPAGLAGSRSPEEASQGAHRGPGGLTHWLAWLGWVLLSLLAVSTGLRFFPRYYFQLLPVLVLLAARGFTLLGRKREIVALLLLIPLARFGPIYFTALRDSTWRDTAMDQDSRAAAALTRQIAQPGDTLFVWGYRPEIFVYTGLPAATMYLDSQPLTGVPADRHLTQSEPVETTDAAHRREELTHSRPTFILDGLSLYNPRLSIASYPELRDWFSQYHEAGRSGEIVIYRLAR